jgi:hypothetical protein
VYGVNHVLQALVASLHSRTVASFTCGYLAPGTGDPTKSSAVVSVYTGD